MSYWGLFWETGMPAVWALSRKYGDRPEACMEVQTQPEGSMPGEAGRFHPEQTGGSGEKQ